MEIKLSSPVLFLSGFSYKVSTASLPFLCLSSLMFSALHLVNCKSRGCRLQDLDNLCYFALRISGPPDHFYYLLLLLSLHLPLVCTFLHPFATTATAQIWQNQLTFRKQWKEHILGLPLVCFCIRFFKMSRGLPWNSSKLTLCFWYYMRTENLIESCCSQGQLLWILVVIPLVWWRHKNGQPGKV